LEGVNISFVSYIFEAFSSFVSFLAGDAPLFPVKDFLLISLLSSTVFSSIKIEKEY